MRRFFINPAQLHNNRGLITDQEARHISQVLRLKAGTHLELFDGEGMVYQAEISAIHKATVETQILSSQRYQATPPFLSVAQSLVKANKMDLIVQKATELGVAEIWPVISQHCAVTSASAHQISRWQRIAHESCKQCNRPMPLLIHETSTLSELYSRTHASVAKIMLWENEADTTLQDVNFTSSKHVSLLIGPEGGFSNAEAEAAIHHGFQTVALGPRILRAETAAIAGITILQFLLGNLQRP